MGYNLELGYIPRIHLLVLLPLGLLYAWTLWWPLVAKGHIPMTLVYWKEVCFPETQAKAPELWD